MLQPADDPFNNLEKGTMGKLLEPVFTTQTILFVSVTCEA
jgi:hypothetical protein